MAASANPRWHGDAKWVFAFLASVTLGLTLLTLGLYRLTDRERAVSITSTILAAFFSPKGLDDETDIAAAKQQVAVQGSFRPFPGSNATVSREEIAGKSAREIRILTFRKIAEPLYDEGPEGFARRASTPEAAEKVRSDTQLIGILSKRNHEFLARPLWILGLCSLLFGALATAFSHRAGRFLTPAVILAVTSIIPAALFGFIKLNAEHASGDSPLGFGAGPVVADASRAVLPLVADAFLFGYLVALGAAGFLLLLSILFTIVQRVRHRKA